VEYFLGRYRDTSWSGAWHEAHFTRGFVTQGNSESFNAATSREGLDSRCTLSEAHVKLGKIMEASNERYMANIVQFETFQKSQDEVLTLRPSGSRYEMLPAGLPQCRALLAPGAQHNLKTEITYVTSSERKYTLVHLGRGQV
jgi:hypothetical protein